MLGHNDMITFYQNIFNMHQHHGYSIQEVENMVIYELEIFNAMIIQYIKDKELLEKNN
jgi:hypothetical protein